MADRLYSVAEIAGIIECNKNYVYSLINNGLLPYLKLGSKKVRAKSLDEFLEKWEGWDLSNPSNPVKIEINTEHVEIIK